MSMSAFGGKADVIQGVAECPLIAISGHTAIRVSSPKSSKIGCTENPLESVQISLEPFPDFVVPDDSALYHGCHRGPHIVDELS